MVMTTISTHIYPFLATPQLLTLPMRLSCREVPPLARLCAFHPRMLTSPRFTPSRIPFNPHYRLYHPQHPLSHTSHTSHTSAQSQRSSTSSSAPPHPVPPFENSRFYLSGRRMWMLLFVGMSGWIIGWPVYSKYRKGMKRGIESGETQTDGFNRTIGRPSMRSLVRAYVVYALCSSPTLVDASPAILKALTESRIPGVRSMVEWVVRRTFFEQFVGGDTARECMPLFDVLRNQNKGVLLGYSVEVDESEDTAATPNTSRVSASPSLSAHRKVLPPHGRIVEEILTSIDVAADYEDSRLQRDLKEPGRRWSGRKTWVAIKLTALLPDAKALIKLSKHIIATRQGDNAVSSGSRVIIPFPGCPETSDLDVLSSPSSSTAQYVGDRESIREEDIKVLTGLRDDLKRICRRARDRGVKIIIDAEYSWYQPAIDAYTLMLMSEFNRGDAAAAGLAKEMQPLVYGTYQAYLRRTPQQLEWGLKHAKLHGYSLGVKLVRGAYHPHELAAHYRTNATVDRTDINKLSGPRSVSISQDVLPPVWMTKGETDQCYNCCVKLLIRAVRDDIRGIPSPTPSVSALKTPMKDANVIKSQKRGGPQKIGEHSIPRIGVLFGTHNWKSCGLILDELVSCGLGKQQQQQPLSITSPPLSLIRTEEEGMAEQEKVVVIDEDVSERIAIGQLYGMSDDLTDWLVNRTYSPSPIIIKYVPYGALLEVMPYLSRRAIENKSVLGDGGAMEERKRAGREIRRRLKEVLNFWSSFFF